MLFIASNLKNIFPILVKIRMGFLCNYSKYFGTNYLLLHQLKNEHE